MLMCGRSLVAFSKYAVYECAARRKDEVAGIKFATATLCCVFYLAVLA